MKKMVLLLSIVLLSGCAGMASITQDEISRADFGVKPTKEESLSKVRSYLSQVLIDPDSLRLACTDVSKGWARENYVADRPNFGYIVICNVNAKNKFGGYTGSKEFVFVFNGSGFYSYKEILPGKEYGYLN